MGRNWNDWFHKSSNQANSFFHKAGGTLSSIFHKVGSGIETGGGFISNIANNPAIQTAASGLALSLGGPEAAMAVQRGLSTIGSLSNQASNAGRFSKSLGDFTNPSNYQGNTVSNITNSLERAQKLNTQRQQIFA